MREHQIVITLKPEQFAEVQRLSKAAGAKSMGIFVRKALLATLGIDGAPPHSLTSSTAEGLRRLQKELKILVADTLSQAESTIAEQIVSVSSSLAELQAQSTEIEVADAEVDETRLALNDSQVFEDEPADLVEDEAEDEAPFLRDPLEELLDRSLMERLQDYVERSKSGTGNQTASAGEDDPDVELPDLPDSDFIDKDSGSFGPDLPLPTKPEEKKPPFSGGPPPKRRP